MTLDVCFIILAGGRGTRIRHLAGDLPKPMMQVAGRPFLEWLLERIATQGYQDVVLSTGYQATKIADHFGSQWGQLAIHYCHEETPLGTGGAIKAAMLSYQANSYIVLNGDTMVSVPYDALLQRAEESGMDCTLAVRAVADTSRFGRVATNPNGLVTRFMEKQAGTPGLINAGVYLLQRSILSHFPPQDTFSFETDFLETLRVPMMTYVIPEHDYFIDIGIEADYRKACVELPALNIT